MINDYLKIISEKKTTSLTVKLSDAQKEIIKTCADSRKLNITDYLLNLVLSDHSKNKKKGV